MAFSITDTELAIAIRAIPNADTPVPAGIALTLRYMSLSAKEMITKYAPGAPIPVSDLALIRLTGYFYDQDPNPDFSRPASSSNALQYSGAASVLSQWRVHRAGAIDVPTTTPATPSSGSGLPPLPPSGNYILTSEGGVLAWVQFPAP